MSTDVHTLAGAYALDALSPEEAAEFRQHLEVCESCRIEVREFRAAAAQMGAAEALAPPPDLKARIMALADRTPQMPPRTPIEGPAAATGPATAPASAPTPAAVPIGEHRDRRAGRVRRWSSRLALAAAAVVLIGGGALGARELLDDSDSSLAAAPVEVFEAPDARTATVETDNGGELRVAVSTSLEEMAVDTRELPPLDDQHVYQIWSVHDDGTMVSAAILGDPGSGAAMGLPEQGTQVAVTVEPSGGSEQPTTDPIAQVDPHQV
jgi:anti-sigma-K factor RskA